MSLLANDKQSLKIMVEIDSSHYVDGRVLFELDKDDLLHLIAILSRNLNYAKWVVICKELY